MISFRPHTAKVTLKAEATYDQNKGEYNNASESNLQFSCRVSSNGSGRKVANKDGVMVEYGFLVHADTNAPAIPYGAKMEVRDLGGTIKARGEVIGVFTNQMNTRIWLA